MKWKPGSDEFGAWLFDIQQEIERLKRLIGYTTTHRKEVSLTEETPLVIEETPSVSREDAQNALKAALLKRK